MELTKEENQLTQEEKYLMIEAINHSIAYRLNNRTRMSEIKTLRELKKKLDPKRE